MKTENIIIRTTPLTKERLQEKAKEYDTSLSNFLLSQALSKPIYVRSLPDINTVILKQELATVGRNIWKLLELKRVFKLSEELRLQMALDELKRVTGKINKHYDDHKGN